MKQPYRTPAVRSVYPMDTGPVDVPKKSCEAPCCKDGGANFEPMPIVVHCPKCGLQHVDQVEEVTDPQTGITTITDWTKRKHRKHLCVPDRGGCGFVWQPAHVFTVGVKFLFLADHKDHGRGDASGPDQSDCICNGTKRQRECAAAGCGFCKVVALAEPERVPLTHYNGTDE